MQRTPLWLVVPFALTGLAGCWDSHTLPPGRFDVVDGSSPGVTRTDAGPSDAGRDPEAPLPREPFVDPGPDARPSDDPAARDWRDPPELDPEDPCCVPLGPTVDLPLADRIIGGLAIEWNGSGWGVLYASLDGAAFQELDRTGLPIGPVRRHEVRGVGADLEWAEGRFAAVVSREGDGPQQTSIALLDRRGVLDAGWTDLGAGLVGTRVARLTHGDRWVTVNSNLPGFGGAGAGQVFVREISARAEIVGTTSFGPNPRERASVAGLKSRAVVFWPTPEATYARVLTRPVAESVDEPVTFPPLAVLAATTRLRDRAVVVGLDERGRGSAIATYDPFTRETSFRESPLTPGILRFVHDAAGIDTLGLIAACYGERLSGPDSQQVTLRLFDGEGAPLGRPVRVSDPGPVNIAWPCAVGSDSEHVYVAWQNQRRDLVRVRGFRVND